MNAFLEECRLLAAVFRLGSGTATVGQWDRIWKAFAGWAERMEAPRFLERCEKAAGRS